MDNRSHHFRYHWPLNRLVDIKHGLLASVNYWINLFQFPSRFRNSGNSHLYCFPGTWYVMNHIFKDLNHWRYKDHDKENNCLIWTENTRKLSSNYMMGVFHQRILGLFWTYFTHKPKNSAPNINMNFTKG